ncbi:hypothetical protein B0H16DRAFT_1710523 [Mycena metata]|uniref:Uncharacterized protein n=1 Tax=Mycena metata TaxID=1033252 RepID=A0AAD7K9T8_9AGAR|nr:hypothetical protein B0H16DRAFT_1710523 [Mycena metata]
MCLAFPSTPNIIVFLVPPLMATWPMLAEITDRILTKVTEDIVTDSNVIKKLCGVNTLFCAILQPHLFRNVNLRSVHEAIKFLDILSTSSRLTTALRVLQISFDLDPDAFFDPAAPSQTGDHGDADMRPDIVLLNRFWQLWTQSTDRLQVLRTLTLCYNPKDTQFLLRFIHRGQTQALAGLRCLNLAYLSKHHPDEAKCVRSSGIVSMPIELRGKQAYWDTPDDPDPGAWDSIRWAQGLCSSTLSQLECIVIMTPGTPFWPPTYKQIQHTVEKWFHELPPTSNLTHVITLYGSENEGRRRDDYVEAYYHCKKGGKAPHVGNGYIGRAHEKPMRDESVWPVNDENSWDPPVAVWERDRDTLQWDKGDPHDDQHPFFAEFRFFDPTFADMGTGAPAYICGYSEIIFETWDGW